MSEAKYICIGGYIISPKDGDKHFVRCESLPGLYGVPPGDCWLARDEETYKQFGHHGPAGGTVLRPDPTGEYKVPKEGEVTG